MVYDGKDSNPRLQLLSAQLCNYMARERFKKGATNAKEVDWQCMSSTDYFIQDMTVWNIVSAAQKFPDSHGTVIQQIPQGFPYI